MSTAVKKKREGEPLPPATAAVPAKRAAESIRILGNMQRLPAALISNILTFCNFQQMARLQQCSVAWQGFISVAWQGFIMNSPISFPCLAPSSVLSITHVDVNLGLLSIFRRAIILSGVDMKSLENILSPARQAYLHTLFLTIPDRYYFSCGSSDDLLSRINDLTKLTTLELQFPMHTPIALSRLSAITNLIRLALVGEVNWTSLTSFAQNNSSLQSLDISDCSFNSDEYWIIRRFSENNSALRRLYLPLIPTPLSASTRFLSQVTTPFPNLQESNMCFRISEDIDRLTRLVPLLGLNLYIKNFHNMKESDVTRTFHSVAQRIAMLHIDTYTYSAKTPRLVDLMSPPANYSRLTSLEFENCNVSKQMLPTHFFHSGITNLVLSWVQITKEQIQALHVSLPQLRLLYLNTGDECLSLNNLDGFGHPTLTDLRIRGEEGESGAKKDLTDTLKRNFPKLKNFDLLKKR